ncbi:MAG: Hpt domain-containing protein [Synechococcus sp.]|nr:Hpt domain-containing protein [Synechococcus sp.]
MVHYSAADEIDLATLTHMVGNDLTILRELVETFLDDTPQLLTAMDNSLRAENATDLMRHAHTLKSSSRLFQMEQFAHQCQTLEEAAAHQNWVRVIPLFQQLQQDYQAIATVLTTKLTQLP